METSALVAIPDLPEYGPEDQRLLTDGSAVRVGDRSAGKDRLRLPWGHLSMWQLNEQLRVRDTAMEIDVPQLFASLD
jgi:hypothetical protein